MSWIRLGVVTCLVLCTAMACDSSGIGAFDRTTEASAAVLGSVSAEGQLDIVELRAIIGTPEPRVLRDPFEYGLEPEHKYWMLLSPSVEDHRDPDQGPGQYSVLYLHEPETDLPADSFPDHETGTTGRDARGFLDCLVQNDETAGSRFDALANAVEGGFEQLSVCG